MLEKYIETLRRWVRAAGAVSLRWLVTTRDGVLDVTRPVLARAGAFVRSHPKISAFNFTLLAGCIGILIYALLQEGPRVYIVEPGDEYVVVLDIGHGGKDPGAVVKDVRTEDGQVVTIYEHGMVFDVGARLFGLLSAHDDIAVLPTLTNEDGELLISQTAIPLPPSRSYLQTHPRADLAETPSTVSVNLRWILANYELRRLRTQTDRGYRVVFVSLHMDEERYSSGGLSVYTPPGPYENDFPERPDPYIRFFEAREWLRDMHLAPPGAQDADRSSELAREIVANFRRHRLRVSEQTTYRKTVAISGEPYVPAVIRYNAVETRALLELANLADPIDRQRVLDPLYRERMAWAIYEGILHVLRTERTEPDTTFSGYPER